MSKLNVGLTGGIGSGKSTVSGLFAKNGIDVIDLDTISRQVVSPGQAVLRTIQNYFGEESIALDGSLNRRYVREQTFSDKTKKHWLDSILHPLIRKSMLEQIRQAKSVYCIVDVPLLTENNMAGLFDRVLLVDCTEEQQLERAAKRDSVSAENIKKIVLAQATRQERKAIADDIINNNCSVEVLEQKVAALHQSYLSITTRSIDNQ